MPTFDFPQWALTKPQLPLNELKPKKNFAPINLFSLRLSYPLLYHIFLKFKIFFISPCSTPYHNLTPFTPRTSAPPHAHAPQLNTLPPPNSTAPSHLTPKHFATISPPSPQRAERIPSQLLQRN